MYKNHYHPLPTCSHFWGGHVAATLHPDAVTALPLSRERAAQHALLQWKGGAVGLQNAITLWGSWPDWLLNTSQFLRHNGPAGELPRRKSSRSLRGSASLPSAWRVERTIQSVQEFARGAFLHGGFQPWVQTAHADTLPWCKKSLHQHSASTLGFCPGAAHLAPPLGQGKQSPQPQIPAFDLHLYFKPFTVQEDLAQGFWAAYIGFGSLLPASPGAGVCSQLHWV